MKHARADYQRIQDPSGAIPADEPVFLLRAQDRLAAAMVLLYADFYEACGGDDQVARHLRDHAAAMKRWPNRRTPTIPREVLR